MTCKSSFLVSGNHTLIVKRVMYHYFEYKHYLIDMLISILGEWRVALYCQGKRIDSCPVDVCDPSRVKVNDLKGGIVGRPNKFNGENHKRKARGGGEQVDTDRGNIPHRNQKELILTLNRCGFYVFLFLVDCSEAGNGDLEVFVKNDKGRVPSFCSDNGRGIYNVHFTPYMKGPHYVSVNFNRAEIRGWLFM